MSELRKKQSIALLSVLVAVALIGGIINFVSSAKADSDSIVVEDGGTLNIYNSDSSLEDTETLGGEIYNRPISFDKGIKIRESITIDGVAGLSADITASTTNGVLCTVADGIITSCN